MAYIFEQGVRKKTRKKHYCCVCDESIPIGSECNYQTNDGGDDADMGTVYWHMDCDTSDIDKEHVLY